MTDRTAGRIVLAMALLAAAGVAAACESDIDRQMRLEREALESSGELDDLKGQLETQNPDPYDPQTRNPTIRGPANRGRSRRR